MYLRSDQQSLWYIYPKRLTISTFGIRSATIHRYRYSKDVVPMSGLQPRPKGTSSFLWDPNPDSGTLTQTELGTQTLQSSCIRSTVSIRSRISPWYPRRDSNPDLKELGPFSGTPTRILGLQPGFNSLSGIRSCISLVKNRK